MPFWKKTSKGGKKKPPKPTVPRTAQQSIPMQRMFEDGTCRVKPNYYTRTIAYQDINYQLAQQEDKTAIFEEWCSFLNFFDSSIKFELSFVNMATDSSEFEKSIRIPFQKDGFDDVRAEYSQMLRQQLGLVRGRLIRLGWAALASPSRFLRFLIFSHSLFRFRRTATARLFRFLRIGGLRCFSGGCRLWRFGGFRLFDFGAGVLPLFRHKFIDFVKGHNHIAGLRYAGPVCSCWGSDAAACSGVVIGSAASGEIFSAGPVFTFSSAIYDPPFR